MSVAAGIYIRAFVSAVFCLALSYHAQAACSKTLMIAYPAWSRASTTASDELQFRLDNELLENIMSIAGCEFESTTLPFKRILEGIKHGSLDGTVAASKSPEREEYAWFTAPYRPEIIALFMRADDIQSFHPQRVSDLVKTQGKIAVGIGTWHGAQFEKLVETNAAFRARLLYIDDAHLQHVSLDRHRANMLVGDLHYSSHILRRHGLLGRILPHPFPISTEDVHLIFSKKSVPAADIGTINAAIERFRGAPTYNKILASYSGN